MSSKIRDALLKADVLVSIATFDEDVNMDEVEKIRSEIKFALAEPLKNCEVGTIGEQIKRFYDEYYAKDSRCSRRWSFGECAIHWSQMPYEEGGAE